MSVAGGMGGKRSPKISVVTVCLNAEKTIGFTLDSIRSQRYGEVEHIVVDGASTDGTLAAIRDRMPHTTRLISEPDHGLYDAMNKGIAAATGDYLGFLNADDVYEHAGVLELVADAVSSTSPDAVHGDLLYVSATDPRKIVRYWKSKPYRAGMFQAGWHPAHPTLFVRTSVLRELGGFDTRFRYHSDFDLMVRLFLERKVSSVHIPHVLVRMRMGGHSNRSLRNILRGNRESLQIARRFGLGSTPLWVAKKLCYRIPQFFRRPSLP